MKMVGNVLPQTGHPPNASYNTAIHWVCFIFFIKSSSSCRRVDAEAHHFCFIVAYLRYGERTEGS